MSIGAVHHSYYVVIFSGGHWLDPGNWSQAQARQHQILFVAGSSGKDCDSIYIFRLVHECKCECSGAGGELYGDTRGKATRNSECGVDHPPPNLNNIVAISSDSAKHPGELLVSEQRFRQTSGAASRKRINTYTADKTFTGICQDMPRVRVNGVGVCITPIVG